MGCCHEHTERCHPHTGCRHAHTERCHAHTEHCHAHTECCHAHTERCHEEADGCDTSPCACDRLPCACDNLPCARDNLSCANDELPCVYDKLPCACDRLPCAMDTVPCAAVIRRPIVVSTGAWASIIVSTTAVLGSPRSSSATPSRSDVGCPPGSPVPGSATVVRPERPPPLEPLSCSSRPVSPTALLCETACMLEAR